VKQLNFYLKSLNTSIYTKVKKDRKAVKFKAALNIALESQK